MIDLPNGIRASRFAPVNQVKCFAVALMPWRAKISRSAGNRRTMRYTTQQPKVNTLSALSQNVNLTLKLNQIGLAPEAARASGS
jgi:hypothetical protein